MQSSLTVWQDMCAEVGVENTVYEALRAAGYESVNTCCFSLRLESDLEEFIDDSLTDDQMAHDLEVDIRRWRRHPAAGKLRQLWWKAWEVVGSSSSHRQSASAGSSPWAGLEMGWTDPPPTRLRPAGATRGGSASS